MSLFGPQLGTELLDAPLRNFRLVEYTWLKPATAEAATSRLVHKDHVARFVTALKELHYAPGVNPHNLESNGGRTAVLGTIRISAIRATGPYWHTTPGLQRNDDPAGAVVFQDGDTLETWEHPALTARYRAEDAAELALEARLA